MHATLGALAALVAIGSAAQAASASHGSCFFVNQSWTWKAPDSRTMYIKVDPGRYFRLDMAGQCPLTWPDAQLVTVHRSTSVCDALDWDLKVKEGPQGPAVPCIVKTMTELTPAEAAKIPPEFKPR